MSNESVYYISFPDLDPRESSIFCAQLKSALLKDCRALNDRSLGLQRSSELNQDLGTTLILILGTEAVVAVAAGIQTWLTRQHAVYIEIKDGEDRIVANNINCKTAEDLSNAFLRRASGDKSKA